MSSVDEAIRYPRPATQCPITLILDVVAPDLPEAVVARGQNLEFFDVCVADGAAARVIQEDERRVVKVHRLDLVVEILALLRIGFRLCAQNQLIQLWVTVL